ncbi:hypothetical protein [Sphingomonas astaxanthinifaciens]|uniref:Major facilitator superfamily (MFS) profile domain-containing protein n=1 Tax=Sphingomonas astaxanthinifaciens DSM 22298 TaxID=1123267 RepID=A0ABQ5Z4U9_9SPHN|nr:hypothetical protein [Sphingomonas astaxanthinifaciens]GLR47815.1 hypothetical protein GCM10007925_15280 [Sphingomonas astaxanthinifaciens DSM 22298]
MLRRIFGTLGGIVAGMANIMLIEWVAHVAIGGDSSSPTTPMLVSVLIAWAAGSLVGSSAALRLARWRGGPWVVGGFIALGVIANQFSVPQPVWMTVVGIAAALVPAWLIATRAPLSA